MKNGILSLLFIMLISPAALAEEFAPTYWSDGLHLFAGGGTNSSMYSSGEDNLDTSVGLSLKTDLTYSLNPEWALEWSANVKFNRVRGFLLWDTLLTLGIRTQLPALNSFDLGSPYARLFVGRAPTVLFLEGRHQDINKGGEVNRIQFDGPVAGIGLGVLNKTKKGQVWFSELSISLQKLEQEEDISMKGDVPVVIAANTIDNNSTIYSVSLTFGVLAF